MNTHGPTFHSRQSLSGSRLQRSRSLNKMTHATKYGQCSTWSSARIYTAFLSAVSRSSPLVKSSSTAIMELVVPKFLHNTSLAASPSLLSIGFALIAALAGLLRIFLRRPKKAALPVFKVKDDVVKALEEAHEAVCIIYPTVQVYQIHECSVLIPRSSSQWLVKK